MLTDTIRPGAVRPLIVMLAALLLTASAIVATTAATMAAKPVPDFNFVDADPPCIGLGGEYEFRVDVQFLVKGAPAKGGWVYVKAQASDDGANWQPDDSWLPFFSPTASRVKAGQPLTLNWKEPNGWGNTTTFRLQIVDRKGEELQDWKTSDPVTCP